MGDSAWISFFGLLDRHPSILVTTLVVAGGMLITFGVRLPQRVKQDDGTTAWALSGGVPGLGVGLVSVGQGLIKFASTFATERERDRNAHKEELLAQKAAIDAVNAQQARTNDTIERLVMELRGIAQGVAQLLGKTGGAPPDRPSSAGKSAACVPGSDC
jgi:hypothetical protein